jgi:Xaa-Pro aminopeptidase
VTGPLDGVVKEAYDVVLARQQAGLEAIRAAIAASTPTPRRARRRRTSFAGRSATGSARLGLEVHEAPRMSTESTDTLAAGNVVTVEPGIYLEGRAGIRIEDNVVVTNGGVDNFTGFART